MNDRKDDIIIGLLVIIIIMQMYGLILDNSGSASALPTGDVPAPVATSDTLQDVPTEASTPTATTADDPYSGANLPGTPVTQWQQR